MAVNEQNIDENGIAQVDDKQSRSGIRVEKQNLTLSDDLSLDIHMARENNYTDYTLSLNSISFNSTGKLAYTGRIYRTGTSIPKLNLHDLIESNSYNNEYMINKDHDVNDYYSSYKIKTTGIKNKYINARVDITSWGTAYRLNNVMCIYSPQRGYGENKIWPDIYGQYKTIHNLLNTTTDILPVIPVYKFRPYDKVNFYFAGILAFNKKCMDDNVVSMPDGSLEPQFKLCYIDKNDQIIYKDKYITGKMDDFITSFEVNGNTLNDLYSGIDKNADRLCVSSLRAELFNDYLRPVAKLDHCPAEYYVIWANRAGAYQCQPFEKKNIMSEGVKSLNITDYNDVKHVGGKTVEYKWKLNSRFLTYEEHDEFESLLVSPVVQLYDVKYNKLIDVIVTTAKWQEKTDKNNKKPFNLMIELQKAKDETMIF